MRKLALSAVLIFTLTVSTAAWAVTLSGTVTDDARPVSGALVHAIPFTPDGSGRAGTVTDADGRFVLIVDRHPSRLIVSKAGCVTTIVNVRQGQRHVDIELAREARALYGRILDHRQQPVPDAWVAVTQLKQPGERVPPRLPGNHQIEALRAKSSWDGTFEIRGLPPWEELTLEARKREFATVIEEIGPGAALEDVGRALHTTPEKTVQIIMPPEATLRGTVTWRGLPMKGIEVSARRGEDWSSTTDDRGSFHISRLPPGEVRLSVRTDNTMAPASSPQTMRLAPGERVDGIEIELVQTAVITGTVTRADTGEPVRAQIGHAFPSWQRGGTSDEDGRYVLRVLPGKQTIMFLRGGPLYRPADPSRRPDLRPSVTVDVEGGQFLEGVDFSIEPWLLGDIVFAGRLRLPDGTPAAEAVVELQAPLMSGSVRPGAEMGRAISDGAGRFEVRPRFLRLEDFYLLRASSANGGLIAARVVPVRGMDDLEISLHEPAYARLPVECEDGTACSPGGLDLTVSARAPGEIPLPLDAEKRTEDGTIVLGPLPPQITLVFRASGSPAHRIRPWGPMTLSLKPGETLGLPRLVAISDDGPWLTGRVVDEEGQPVEGARVMISPRHTAARPVITGAEGEFRIQALSFHRDRLGLIAATEDGTRCRGLWLGDETEGEHVLRLAAPISVSGRVFSADGRPSAGVTVRARAVWDGESTVAGATLRTQYSVQTDAAGRFTIDGLIPGLSWALSAEDRLIRAEAQHFLPQIEPEEREPVELRLQSRQ